MTPAEEAGPGGLAEVTKSSLWMPNHLVSSAWTEHAPFAFWLVEAHRPRSIVELGTHNGLSYFTFCQAVSELGLSTRCFAVDTWEGDEHAGFYSGEVYELVARVNTDRYAAFSRLVRSTFDAAVDHFDDGSIDLLHIDGRHFYEDVAHDFFTWLPKLSGRAVVLFHDTNVREKRFGVHRLWNELRSDYHGSLEFLHGHGLGVLQVGAHVDPALAMWFERHRESGALAALRASYARLGRGVLDRFEVEQSALRLRELERKLTDANAAIDRRNESVRRLEASQQLTRAALDQARAGAGTAALERPRDGADEALERVQAEVQRLGDELQRSREEAEAATQLLAVELEHAAKTRRQLHRLRSRKAVRLALAMANGLRPFFNFVRRVRRPPSTTRPEVSTPAGVRDHARQSVPEEASPPRQVADGARNTMVVDTIRDGAALRAGLRRVGMPTIVVPIFNAPRELSRCLASIERNTTVPAALLLINDASTDPRVQEVLEPWRNRPHVRVLDHDVNRGFTATVNHGFDETDADVIVLNSDTEVPPSWIQNLRRAAYTDASIGTVTPLSDNSGAFSVPNVGERNQIPVHLGTDGLSRLISQDSLHSLPDTPTGNGFCWYVKRSVIRSIGKLDEEGFPRGYGEENDFCMRASQAGWRHVVDDSTYVAHMREASFGSEKGGLVAAGRRVVDDRYPEYRDQVRAFVHGPEMEAVRDNVASLLAGLPAEVPPRILFVAQIGQGGTPATTRDLANSIDGWAPFIFEADGHQVRLLSIEGGVEEVLEQFYLSHPVVFADREHDEYDAALAGVLRRYSIELVHVRHLIKQPLSAAHVASAHGIPVVVSFHDYYFSCPTVHLLDDKGRFCRGTCTPGMGTCRVPTRWIADTVPELKHAWVHTWRGLVGDAFEYVDAFVTTSEAAREVMADSLPQLRERHFEVIEHGRKIPQDSLAEVPLGSQPVRVLVPGNLDQHKGERLLRNVRALDVDGRFEFHFVGSTSEDTQSVGIVHGRYDRDDLAEIVRGIRPSFAAILSPWGETYCHTLTEAWSLGLPVVACDEGALGERVRRHGGGLLVDPYDAEATYKAMCRLVDDPGLYASLVQEADEFLPRPVGEMARDYEELYLDVLHARRRFAVDPTRPRIGLVVPSGSDSEKWTGSTHIRFGRRYSHPRVRALMSVRFLDGVDDVATRELDAVMVLRNGAIGKELNRLLAIARDRKVSVVLDLDDALTERELFPPTSPWRETAYDITRLASEADFVTVSTEPLRQLVFENYNENVAVQVNALDERLWFSPLQPTPAEEDRPARVLYFGTTTHTADLDLLRDVLPAVAQQIGRDVRLEVVGVSEPAGEEDWFDRLDVPHRSKPYPEFVKWLRRHRTRWDVGVAPLRKGGMNDYKSDLKFLELSALGLPTVASRVPAYERTVMHGSSGYLANETPDDWVDGIVRALQRPEGDAWAAKAVRHVWDSRLLRDMPARPLNCRSISAESTGSYGVTEQG